MREVAIVGANMIKFGRYPEKPLPALMAEATLGALKDAGIGIGDVEVVVSGVIMDPGAGQKMMKLVGTTGVPVINVGNACATGSTAVREAWLHVASGECDIALAVGAEQQGKRGLLGTGGMDPTYSTEGVMGTDLMPGLFSQIGVEHMRKYGTTPEQFAKVAVKNHKNGTVNPYAQYQMETPLEMVLSARMVAWPNTLYMCCPTGDGAAAMVLMSAEKARQYTQKPLWLAASVLTSDPYQPRNPTLPDINQVTRNAAKEAYKRAGIGPEDLSMVELHDCFATAELVHYENLGLCADGEAGRMIDTGETQIGGRIPVNASGGLLCKGHPIGSTGVANIVEIVWHLRGQAGARQVEGAKTGLAHVIGLGSAATVNIVKK